MLVGPADSEAENEFSDPRSDDEASYVSGTRQELPMFETMPLSSVGWLWTSQVRSISGLSKFGAKQVPKRQRGAQI